MYCITRIFRTRRFTITFQCFRNSTERIFHISILTDQNKELLNRTGQTSDCCLPVAVSETFLWQHWCTQGEDFVNTMNSKILCDLCFSPNQPLKSGDDQCTGILKNIIKTYEYGDFFLVSFSLPCNLTRCWLRDIDIIFITQFLKSYINYRQPQGQFFTPPHHKEKFWVCMYMVGLGLKLLYDYCKGLIQSFFQHSHSTTFIQHTQQG